MGLLLKVKLLVFSRVTATSAGSADIFGVTGDAIVYYTRALRHTPRNERYEAGRQKFPNCNPVVGALVPSCYNCQNQSGSKSEAISDQF